MEQDKPLEQGISLQVPVHDEPMIFLAKPKDMPVDVPLQPKDRQELSVEKSMVADVITYSDGTVRKDWKVAQKNVSQPLDGSLPIQ